MVTATTNTLEQNQPAGSLQLDTETKNTLRSNAQWGDQNAERQLSVANLQQFVNTHLEIAKYMSKDQLIGTIAETEVRNDEEEDKLSKTLALNNAATDAQQAAADKQAEQEAAEKAYDTHILTGDELIHYNDEVKQVTQQVDQTKVELDQDKKNLDQIKKTNEDNRLHDSNGDNIVIDDVNSKDDPNNPQFYDITTHQKITDPAKIKQLQSQVKPTTTRLSDENAADDMEKRYKQLHKENKDQKNGITSNANNPKPNGSNQKDVNQQQQAAGNTASGTHTLTNDEKKQLNKFHDRKDQRELEKNYDPNNNNNQNKRDTNKFVEAAKNKDQANLANDKSQKHGATADDMKSRLAALPKAKNNGDQKSATNPTATPPASQPNTLASDQKTNTPTPPQPATTPAATPPASQPNTVASNQKTNTPATPSSSAQASGQNNTPPSSSSWASSFASSLQNLGTDIDGELSKLKNRMLSAFTAAGSQTPASTPNVPSPTVVANNTTQPNQVVPKQPAGPAV